MTDRVKEFKIEQVGNLYVIKLAGGGEVPAKLSGFWTSPNIANTFIDTFLRDEEAEKAKKAAKKQATAK